MFLMLFVTIFFKKCCAVLLFVCLHPESYILNGWAIQVLLVYQLPFETTIQSYNSVPKKIALQLVLTVMIDTASQGSRDHHLHTSQAACDKQS